MINHSLSIMRDLKNFVYSAHIIKSLTNYFYEGLTPQYRSIIDATSGGALVNKTPEAVRQLISNMAANSKQFGIRGDFYTKRVNDISSSSLELKVDELNSFMCAMMSGDVQQVKTCDICSMNGYSSDMCPTIQDNPIKHANAIVIG